MLFSEIYGTYYNVLARILGLAVKEELTKEELYRIVQEQGFQESVLTIPQMLEDQTWPLLQEDMTTPLLDVPAMPLTLLQKRWLKQLLSDPRAALFDLPLEGLEDVEPLYPRDAIVLYDRYGDGDPYEDPAYVKNFRTVLQAIREKRRLRVAFSGGKGKEHCWDLIPHRLEYSAKDDKFRLICVGNGNSYPINLGRVQSCELLGHYLPEEFCPVPMARKILVLELTDRRNALERCLFHFSHLSKETERIGEDRYRITLHYELADETELLIRVLSFGPMLKVIFPEDFRRRLCKRLENQKNVGRN